MLGHFLCGVEGVKDFVNIHLHCPQPEKHEQTVDVAQLWKNFRGRHALKIAFF